MNTRLETFFASCPRGLEAVLSRELEALGGHSLAATAGGVEFAGPFELCYRANLESRVASRILWRVASASYRHEQDLYRLALDQPWETWFAPRCTIKVKVSAQRCPLKSLDFVTLRIKDAVCDRFARRANLRPSVDTVKPDLRIEAFLDDARAILYLDTSGDALFKRGLRKAGSDAPLRENLAAGILSLSGWTPEQPLLDPMCGGGTILLEAAQIAVQRAPGLDRRFAFEKLRGFEARHWQRLVEAARARRTSGRTLAVYGCDKDLRAIRTAQTNLEAAGLAGTVTLAQADVLDLKPPAETGILIMNPPYGVRLGQQEELAAFYPQLGDALKQRFAGWRAYIFSADPRLPKLIGLAPTRRTPLFNGALECRLFEFKLVSGPARRRLR